MGEPENTPQPLDIIYLFRHSRHHDEELRFSLRSVAATLPFIRKVWIFGDRPDFLTDDRSLIEHVPHEYIAPLLGFKTPVRSDMLMLVLASLLREVLAINSNSLTTNDLKPNLAHPFPPKNQKREALPHAVP